MPSVRASASRIAEDVGIVEAEPARRCPLPARRAAPRGAHRRSPDPRAGSRAGGTGVFDIGVDVAGLQAVPEHPCAAELSPVRRAESPRFRVSSVIISPRITDSVKVFEPITTGDESRSSACPAASAGNRERERHPGTECRRAPRHAGSADTSSPPGRRRAGAAPRRSPQRTHRRVPPPAPRGYRAARSARRASGSGLRRDSPPRRCRVSRRVRTLRSARKSCRSSRCRSWRTIGSSAPSGSSSSSSAGSSISARARLTRWRSPPDRFTGRRAMWSGVR